MSWRLYDFTIKEWHGSFPNEGVFHFIFSATINKEGNSGTIKHIKREFTVFCEPNDDNGFSRTVRIKIISSDTKLNLGSSATATTALLNKLFSIYDNAILKVKFDGTILKIKNHIQIQKKWKIIKDIIEDNYKGNSIRRFIRSVESRLETENKMNKDISSFENFGLLFHHIYGKYGHFHPVYKEFQFIGIKKIYSIQEEIKVTEVNDTHVLLTIEKDVNAADDDLSYSGNYQIHNINQWIEKASFKIKENYSGIEQLSEFYLQQKA